MSEDPAAPVNLYDVDWATLPVPEDDGAADHLRGMAMPSVPLHATSGGAVDVSVLPGVCVIYIYPMTGTPGTDMPDGWDAIPGARGCTPQSCAFRDHFADLRAAGADHVFGVSAQSPDEQAAAAARLHLPFCLLSDAEGRLADAMGLPGFEAGGRRLLKRVTLILRDGRVAALRYPVFPPDSDAAWVLGQLGTPASG